MDNPGRSIKSVTCNVAISLGVFLLVASIILLPLVLIDNDDEVQLVNNTERSSIQSTSQIADRVIVRPLYLPFEVPLYDGFKIFVETHFDDGCPSGPGVVVAFGKQDCQAICNNVNGCVGFNFDTTIKKCMFFTQKHCVEKFKTSENDHTYGYLKNTNL